ncbi:hypothetical protein [Legionella cincinnatiensis]|uniref:Uncharacterized protein n=1 Tax=Legionella cincinnatiensis TaxID=28085 RepID=A0A378IK40_9GAMM|nr:hypothetical protein [Legionella cincinnatiensis]KTC83231.1 hypothetical protein Lcin_2603 [Legionella cincinnatiensis]STX35637.1 Uncharacterised protein [Legionella cincinnatiensis]
MALIQVFTPDISNGATGSVDKNLIAMIKIILFPGAVRKMLKFYTFISLSLIASMGFAKPCSHYRSCLILKNQHPQFAMIKCNGLSAVTSEGNTEGSTQLDLSYGDGLGAPEPRALYCSFITAQTQHDFNFYNPYWGSRIEFNLISEKQLDVRVIDGWGSRDTKYKFKW